MWLSKKTILIVLVMTYGYQADTMMGEVPKRDGENSFTDESESEDLNVILKVEPPENFTLIIPKECQESSICEHVPNYPQEYVSNIISLLAKLKIKLHTDVDARENVTTDVDDNDKEGELCQSQERVYYPQAGHVNFNWQVILNSIEVTQNVRGRECIYSNTKDRNCSHIRQFSNNHYGKCAPEYDRKLLLGLDSSMTKVIRQYIDVSVCCVCKVVN